MNDSRWPSVMLDPHQIVVDTIRDWLILHDFDGRHLTWRATGEDTEEEWIGSVDVVALIEDCP